ncbi:aminoglycoside phosphotransferase family protein [Streptomyces griseus]|uniref:Aminoglycoside phosphotransferase family protein n=1 Tax=Streptomyces stephensoniae TaxID=3375367 RepID=A0ABU2WB69_9ACTN|nr:aminoglycoside phosphotransferase family protein [Streptomyces griseus]MDT0495097.1 aminoglycoside phosphotransferase family protein [Streptomyces griseus]
MSILTTHRALLSRLLPDDQANELAVRQGQFHDVVMGSDRVVCLPRTPAAAGRLPERVAALRALAPLDLGFRTPEPLLHDSAPGADGTPFLVLSRIPGEPLDADALRDADADADADARARVAESVAAQYATVLAGLDRAGADGAVRAVLPEAAPDRWQRFAESVRAELFPLLSGQGRRRAERELAAVQSLPHLTRAVVHGDLGPENVLWEWTDGLPRLSGVLDWDGVELGDPAEDLAAIGAGHGRQLLERVIALGGRPDSGLTTRVDAIRGTFALQQALYAILDGDEEELADGLTGYR